MTVPVPGSGDALRVENGDTGEVRVLQQQVVEVVHDDEVVELRRGTQ